MRGAWIEIPACRTVSSALLSLPVRGAWIEITRMAVALVLRKSLPVRGAWIEMLGFKNRGIKKSVAPCEGSVD